MAAKNLLGKILVPAAILSSALVVGLIGRANLQKSKPQEKQESVLEREARLNSYPTTYIVDVNGDGIDDFVVKRHNDYTAYLRDDWAESKSTELSKDQWIDVKKKLKENYK